MSPDTFFQLFHLASGVAISVALVAGGVMWKYQHCYRLTENWL